MTRLTNQEKSAMRYASLTALAIQVAKENEDFRKFCKVSVMYDEKKPFLREGQVTWRKLETWIKRQFEAGVKVRIIVDTGSGDD